FIDGVPFGFSLAQTVGERGSRRLVDDALDLETRDLARVFSGLSLCVVEVSGHGDDGIRHSSTEKIFCGGLQALQHDAGDFRRTIGASLHTNARVAVLRINDLKSRRLARAL